jgi:hypothetical protein
LKAAGFERRFFSTCCFHGIQIPIAVERSIILADYRWDTKSSVYLASWEKRQNYSLPCNAGEG